jgi:hypothetical protein
MMQIVTWLSVLVLGPGSIAIFIWFLMSLRGILRERNADEEA